MEVMSSYWFAKENLVLMFDSLLHHYLPLNVAESNLENHRKNTDVGESWL